MAFEVGTDIEGDCTKCGDVWHVIVAKVGEKVTKVLCKQCGKQHRLRPTGAAPEANLNPTRKKVASGSKKAGAKKAARGTKAVTPALVVDLNMPMLPYAMSTRFAEGDQIRHKKFGDGVVFGLEEGKIRVQFMSAGVKVLLHDRN